MITYLTGDATRPQGDGEKVIVHVCNDIGGWGSGFVVALSRRWPEPERAYRAWHADPEADPPFALGHVQFVRVEDSLHIANMVGQRGVGRRPDGSPPVDYDAVRTGLATVRAWCVEHGASVHAPRFGAGLAGGDWSHIEAIINEELIDHGIAATIYDLA